MFPFLHAISHFHLSTLTHLSPLATTNHLAVYGKHFNIYQSFLCVISCIKSSKQQQQQQQLQRCPEPFRHDCCGTAPWRSMMDSASRESGGCLCGMRISLEDQCTINNLTHNTLLSSPPRSPTAEINTPN